MFIKQFYELDKIEKEHLMQDILTDDLMVVSLGIYQLSSLSGILVIDEGEIKGVLTFKAY